MFESKYSKVLTAILIIVILAIIALLGFLGYDYYQKFVITQDTSDFVDNFQGEVSNESPDTEEPTESEEQGEGEEQEQESEDPFANIQATETGNGTTQTVQTYKGFRVLGTIEIPATGIKYPILEKVTKKSIEVAVAFLWGVGLNKEGNSVIIGHNYRNELFFSNNKKLNKGDKIYITDETGKRVTYSVYNKFEAGANDTTFYQRNTNGKPEITLSTCTENVNTRLIILASAD